MQQQLSIPEGARIVQHRGKRKKCSRELERGPLYDFLRCCLCHGLVETKLSQKGIRTMQKHLKQVHGVQAN